VLHGRQLNSDEREDIIKEMLKVLLRKLDKAADAEDTQPRAYNVSEDQHKNNHNVVSHQRPLSDVVYIHTASTITLYLCLSLVRQNCNMTTGIRKYSIDADVN